VTDSEQAEELGGHPRGWRVVKRTFWSDPQGGQIRYPIGTHTRPQGSALSAQHPATRHKGNACPRLGSFIHLPNLSLLSFNDELKRQMNERG